MVGQCSGLEAAAFCVPEKPEKCPSYQQVTFSNLITSVTPWAAQILRSHCCEPLGRYDPKKGKMITQQLVNCPHWVFDQPLLWDAVLRLGSE